MEIIGNMLRECFSQGLMARLDDKRPDEGIGEWFARLGAVDYEDGFVSYHHGIRQNGDD